MKKKQAGLALSGLIFWGIVVAMVAVTGMRVVPSVVEYQSILKSARSVANEAGEQAAVADIRAAFNRFRDVNGFDAVRGEDLEIAKEGGKVVISFAYEKKIPLFANVSLVIDYKGSTR